MLELLVNQLEIEAPTPYNAIPYDYRISQIIVEGALGIVPEITPKILENEDGKAIRLSNNTETFARWWKEYKHDVPFKETPVIQNFAATNIIPRHIGPEYIIHGAKLYSQWEPTRTSITLVISEWYNDRSNHLLSRIDNADHPFSELIVMLPPDIMTPEYYNMTTMKVTPQHRATSDFMDMCEAKVETEWFMMTNAYHQVAFHVDSMFTPASLKPVIPYTPATYSFCFKYPFCKKTVTLAQRFNPAHDKVVEDFDMLYNTAQRNAFCKEWKSRYGQEGEKLEESKNHGDPTVHRSLEGPQGPTGTSYVAYLVANNKDKMYKFTDRSLYGSRPAFFKVFSIEEKLDAMSSQEQKKHITSIGGYRRVQYNETCYCNIYDEAECILQSDWCDWRKFFEKCRPKAQFEGVGTNCTTDPWTGEYYEVNVTTQVPTPVPTTPPYKSDWTKYPVSPPPTSPDKWEYGKYTPGPTKPDEPLPPTPKPTPFPISFKIDKWHAKHFAKGTLSPTSAPTSAPTPPPPKPDDGYQVDPYYAEHHPGLNTLPPSKPDDDYQVDPYYAEHHPGLNTPPPSKPDDDGYKVDPYYSEHHPGLNTPPPNKPDENFQADPYYSEHHPALVTPSPDSVESKKIESWNAESHPNQVPSPRVQGYTLSDYLSQVQSTKALPVKDHIVKQLKHGSYLAGNQTQERSELYQNVQKNAAFDINAQESSLRRNLNNNDLTIQNVALNSLLADIPRVDHLTSKLGASTRLKAGSMVNSFPVQAPTTIPEKKCSIWGPSLVPRHPLEDDILLNLLTTPNQQISKIQRKSIVEEEVIDFVPANSTPIMKLDELRIGAEEFGMGILTPSFSSQAGSLNQFISNIDYGTCHPHEEHASDCDETNSHKPIRISFITYELESLRSQLQSDNSTYATNKVARIDKMLNEILPSVARLWSNALSVIPIKTYLYPVGNACGEATIFSSHKASGISNSDLAIYVTAEGSFCSGVPSYTSVCNYDQHMRPIVG